MQKQQSALTVVFKLVMGGLTSIILVVLGRVNLQFQGPFVPFLRGHLMLEYLQDSSQDMAQNIIYSPGERAKDP